MTGIKRAVQRAIAPLPARPKRQSPVAMTPLSATVDEGPDDIVRLDLGKKRSLVKMIDNQGIRKGMTINVLDDTICVGDRISFNEQRNPDKRYTSAVVSIVRGYGAYHITTGGNLSKYLLLRNNVTAITRSQAIQEEQAPSSTSLWERFRGVFSRK